MARLKKNDNCVLNTNPPEENSENNQEQTKIGQATISASYGRKVNLKSVSTQFDNIDESFHATSTITYRNPEEFKRKAEILSNLVREITEKEIGKTISKLIKMKEDTDNNALLGIGVNIEHQKFLQEEFGDLSEFLTEGESSIDAVITKLSDIKEVELDSVEV